MGGARLAGEDDRVVRRLVRESAVVEEVHTDEVCERLRYPGARPTPNRVARKRSGTDEHGGGDEEHAACDESDPHATPLCRSILPRMVRPGVLYGIRGTTEPRSRAHTFEPTIVRFGLSSNLRSRAKSTSIGSSRLRTSPTSTSRVCQGWSAD